MSEIDDSELIKTIANFLEMGHVENIVAMFKQDKYYYRLTGELLKDERFIVRIGMAVLFEELCAIDCKNASLAIPSLLPLLGESTAYMRADAATLLGIIGTGAAIDPLKRLLHDPDKQVLEIVTDILDEKTKKSNQ